MAVSTVDRIRELAGDERAGRYARAEVRRAQRDFIRRQWKFLGGVAAAICAGGVLAAAIAPSDFERGLLVGGGLTAAAAAVMHFVSVLTGSGPRGMGEAAEQWTAQELRPLLNHGWRLVNHISLQGKADLDHVLVGPGGLYVLETKWSATPYKLSPPDPTTLSASRSVSEQAARLSRALPRRSEIGNALPLVVLWGAASERLREEADPVAVSTTDARVIAGLKLRDWAMRRGRTALTPEQVATVWGELDRYARYTDDREPPVPDSISDGLTAFSLAIGAAMLTILAIAEAARAPHGWLVALVTAGVLVTGSLLLRRGVTAKIILRPVLTGIATSAVMGAVIWTAAIIWTLAVGGTLE
jgi:hypothetical protein